MSSFHVANAKKLLRSDRLMTERLELRLLGTQDNLHRLRWKRIAHLHDLSAATSHFVCFPDDFSSVATRPSSEFRVPSSLVHGKFVSSISTHSSLGSSI